MYHPWNNTPRKPEPAWKKTARAAITRFFPLILALTFVLGTGAWIATMWGINEGLIAMGWTELGCLRVPFSLVMGTAIYLGIAALIFGPRRRK